MAVSYEGADGVGTITLDKPPANSYDLDMMREFSAAVEDAIGDGVRAVVLRSASERFFCAGADIKRFAEGDVAANMEMIRVSQAAFRRMAAAEPVFIAHIAGHALGGGLELTLACDIRLATAGSYKLGTPEVSLGLLPGNGGTQRLTRLLGPSRAMELLVTGRTFSPQDALAWGLVAHVFEPGEAEDRVADYAQRFTTGAALAAAAIKRCVHEGGQMNLADGLALEAEQMERLFGTRDAAEGLQAFVEKRAPGFVGE